ncbi:VOC family protein [Nocardia sp. alder85J]|uniref:VOC family protein n=1 Tax=Nocardia sp. alder85J TaxID=2862949 RepID=UPI001CD7B79A|nr:VOC family protein [Nocardia sp. alder85J]MCX4095789.1 hypothetical protein [Nocardia sp. alder85J]
MPGQDEGDGPAVLRSDALDETFGDEAVDEADRARVSIGAGRPDFQPGADRWRVLLDPDGRPFCLSPRPAATP